MVAHSLRGTSDPPPVTLLLHRKTLLEEWENGPQEIRLTTDEVVEARTGFDVELAIPQAILRGQRVRGETPSGIQETDQDAPSEPATENPNSQETPITPIHNLIVTVKASHTVPALSAIQHRLSPSSTILFLQNGMGILDEVNTHIFPTPSTRPTYIQGIISHGINSQSAFSATHAGRGTIALGVLPRAEQAPSSSSTNDPFNPSSSTELATSTNHLITTLTRAPVLGASLSPWPELLNLQLSKLAANAMINPLTALLSVRNGALLHSPSTLSLTRALLTEISLVFRALPELRDDPAAQARFSVERLEEMVHGVARLTGQNVSSMLADVRAGRGTEVRYINGYVVRRGREVGVACPVNETIVQLVEGGRELGEMGLVARGRGEDVPFVKDGEGK